MRYLIIHSKYSRVGGEEMVVENQKRLLLEAGHEVVLYQRDYSEMKSWRFGRLSSFFSAFYNRRSVRELRSIVRDYKPHVAIIHNLFPVVSPAVLPVLKKRGVRVLMSVHNYRLLCPTGLFYREGAVCEKCASGALREWNCALNRCEGSVLGSFAYASRSWWARKRAYYTKNVDLFMPVSAFVGRKLKEYGFHKDKIQPLTNSVNLPVLQDSSEVEKEKYVGFSGRLSPEKGVEVLFRIARKMPDVKFRAAGGAAQGFSLGDVPTNVEILGHLDARALDEFYRNSSVVINCSVVYEGLPLSILEAMSYGKAVVGQSFGALSELLECDKRGLLVEYGDVDGFAKAIRTLFDNPTQAKELGSVAREYIANNLSEKEYLRRLEQYSTSEYR